MGLARKMVGGLVKNAWTRFMDRVGGRFVSGMADTSSDAPSAGYEPKRDLYRKMQEQRLAQAGQAETGADDAEGGDGQSR